MNISLSDIAAIVAAAHLQGPPTVRADLDGKPVRVLTLRGSRPGELYDFTLDDGHRRWRLESVSHESGVDTHGRTLGRRLSARLNVLHGTAAEHFGQRPLALP
ncbi:hypothetical protein [Streptomyces aurantiogriseus]|uniref:Uncharacterized protein n=1 Tax=Streptomyces aurantiogriseus TaxID=66870 RepID=A0A918C4Q7_9ACTN|nr:hypothetical protein [Streptomyces aurantiogriseus]GGR06688.1 hypothetical protein GCM10010251_23070 [Streptomyces aurantiogriseus]